MTDKKDIKDIHKNIFDYDRRTQEINRELGYASQELRPGDLLGALEVAKLYYKLMDRQKARPGKVKTSREEYYKRGDHNLDNVVLYENAISPFYKDIFEAVQENPLGINPSDVIEPLIRLADYIFQHQPVKGVSIHLLKIPDEWYEWGPKESDLSNLLPDKEQLPSHYDAETRGPNPRWVSLVNVARLRKSCDPLKDD
ncbi:MAG: hypothetical protein GY762_04870, partial [Proteobacteria bacterium]|nr:hypothetical protein [Pseudomonadota bacterium]